MPSAKISSPINTVQKKVEKSKKVEIQQKFVAPEKPGENQNASELANRMSGGYSGWSAPPTVFKEKSLLEIEEEKRRKKAEDTQVQTVTWNEDDSRFVLLSDKCTLDM